MNWQEVLKAERLDMANPIQYPREEVSELLRQTMNKTKFHKGVNGLVPELARFAYIDKRRSQQYLDLADEIKKVAMKVRKLITDYENKEG